MTYILVCDGCGKAQLESFDESKRPSWRTYAMMDEDITFTEGALKGRPWEFHFHNDECAMIGLKKLYQKDLNLEEYLREHKIELL